MAAWPETDELARVLSVDDLDTWQDTLDRIMSAAIVQVQEDVGHWDEYEDEPDDKLAQAALRMAELISTRPSIAERPLNDPIYNGLLKGRRRVFGFA